MAITIALVGAGSQSFAPSSVRDIFLSQPLTKAGVDLRLMDIKPERLGNLQRYCGYLNEKLQTTVTVTATTDLAAALTKADFVITAIEVDRYRYWAQDYHVPRQFGFRQIFGENGGPGGLFHALRNMVPMLEIARTMERLCPRALLLNYSNPEHKLCEMVSRLTAIKSYGLCHGVFMGVHQVAHILGLPAGEIEFSACGMNHFTFYQKLVHKTTGEDLYPRLRQAEREGDWLCQWHELALGRVLFRRFGLWPSPGANHYGEYIRWAEEFVASQMQFYYEPTEGTPWQTGREAQFVYTIDRVKHDRPWRKEPAKARALEQEEIRGSGEVGIPIIEAVAGAEDRLIPAVNTMNQGAIPNLAPDMTVEVPAQASRAGLVNVQMAELPEALAAMLRVQGSIQKLLVEAFAERSKDKLLAALLLDPTVDSYHRAVALLDTMLDLQKAILPEFK